MNSTGGPAGGLDEQVPDVAALRAALDATGYLADDELATALFLAARMGQPAADQPGLHLSEER